MTDHRNAVQVELEAIRRRNGGILKAEDVVEFARVDTTALHSEFEWDDSKASAAYRLVQARKVIRVTVQMLPSPHATDEPIRAYVSVLSDRVLPGGGYRSFSEVMSDDDFREELINDALGEVKRWRRKYDRLRELSPIFRAIDRVEQKQLVEQE